MPAATGCTSDDLVSSCSLRCSQRNMTSTNVVGWAPISTNRSHRLLVRAGRNWQVLDDESRQAVTVMSQELRSSCSCLSWCCDGASLILTESMGIMNVISVMDASSGQITAGPLRLQWTGYTFSFDTSLAISPDGCAIALPVSPATVHLCDSGSLQVRASLTCQPLVPDDSMQSPLWVGWTAQDLVIAAWGLSQKRDLLQLTVHEDSAGALVHSIKLPLDIDPDDLEDSESSEDDSYPTVDIQLLPGQSFVTFWSAAESILLLDAAVGVVHRVPTSGRHPRWTPCGSYFFAPGYEASEEGKLVEASSQAILAEVADLPLRSLWSWPVWSSVRNMCLLVGPMEIMNLASPPSQHVRCELGKPNEGDMECCIMEFSPCVCGFRVDGKPILTYATFCLKAFFQLRILIGNAAAYLWPASRLRQRPSVILYPVLFV